MKESPKLLLLGAVVMFLLSSVISCSESRKPPAVYETGDMNLDFVKAPIAGDTAAAAIDLAEVRVILQKLDDQFAEDFMRADSIALAAHYAKDGTFGSVKGKDKLISAWGRAIRYANKNGTPNVKYNITSVSRDGEFVIETGTYAFADTNDIVKSTGKYLVVRKLEEGVWKMYRDIGL